MKRHLLTKIQNRTATIAVIGLAPFGLAQDMLRPGPLRLSSGHASTGPSITPLDVLGRGPFDKLRTQLRASPAQDAVVDALNEAGKPLKGSNVLVLKDASQCWA